MYIWKVVAFPSWESCHLGNFYSGKCILGSFSFMGKLPLGKLSFGKMYIWEVAAWEIAHWGSCYLGKYPLEVLGKGLWESIENPTVYDIAKL